MLRASRLFNALKWNPNMTRSFLSSQLYQDRLSSSFSFYDVLASLPKRKYEFRRKDFALRLKIPELCKVDAFPVFKRLYNAKPSSQGLSSSRNLYSPLTSTHQSLTLKPEKKMSLPYSKSPFPRFSRLFRYLASTTLRTAGLHVNLVMRV